MQIYLHSGGAFLYSFYLYSRGVYRNRNNRALVAKNRRPLRCERSALAN